MRLSKIYCNKPKKFGPILFCPGLNVVIAESQKPEHKDKDTHNLGKSTLCKLLNFCLLQRVDKDSFLQKDCFKDFVFFLEVELLDSSFLTIRREPQKATKISLKRHDCSNQDYSGLGEKQWDHWELSFNKAKQTVDGLLDLQALKPWDFRDEFGYLLRSQGDFDDVFQLKRSSHGKHEYWKPYVAHVLGFDSNLIKDYYNKQNDLEKKNFDIITLSGEIGEETEELSKIVGILQFNYRDIKEKQDLLDSFDFRKQDKEQTKQLVDEIDEEISSLNKKRYYLSSSQRKIKSSMKEEQILFSPEHAGKLFREMGVVFEGQIKKDFEQLLAFNTAITEERRQYLQKELEDNKKKISAINKRRNKLGKKRSGILSFLEEDDVFEKYKELSNQMVKLQADITSLEYKRNGLLELQKKRKEFRELKAEKERMQEDVEKNVREQSSDDTGIFYKIREYFSDIIERVVSHKAIISVPVNKQGNLDFKAEILDESQNATAANDGHSYKKLLCIAFDMAILRAYLNAKFPHFVFHDGIFETLDDRKKENLLDVIREYADLGIQQIITLIDSDLPGGPTPQAREEFFNDDEIVCTLHDDGIQGRLFRMEPW